MSLQRSNTLPDPLSLTPVLAQGSRRKRSLSPSEDGGHELYRKRLRRTSTLSFPVLSGGPSRVTDDMFNPPGPPPYYESASMFTEPALPRHRPRLLSASSSISSYSTLDRYQRRSRDPLDIALGLSRSTSMTSLRDFRSSSPVVPPFPETSAKFHLRSGKVAIDFSVSGANGAWPVSWSVNNTLAFSRGNRVYCKNLSSSEDAMQLCKIRDNCGDLRLLECGGKDQPNIVAVSTGRGLVQIWDLAAKKMTTSWTTSGVATMRWNGPVLTVGGNRGAIRHYDTRIKETAKMKEQTKKVIRHQGQICGMAWHEEGKLYASGDVNGLVHCWDARQQNTPLDVGEMIQRRKKIQHVGPVRALAWCPWQTKVLATGDSASDGTGTIRIWNINTSSVHATSNYPDKLELDAEVTSLHFSYQCRELLSTHGPGKSTPAPTTPALDLGPDLPIQLNTDPIPARMANSVVVHSYPHLRHVVTINVASSSIAGSVMSPNGQRVVLAVPEENKLKIWDVWGKRKELKRQDSSLSLARAIR